VGKVVITDTVNRVSVDEDIVTVSPSSTEREVITVFNGGGGGGSTTTITLSDVSDLAIAYAVALG
jgi:hypothetical protein